MAYGGPNGTGLGPRGVHAGSAHYGHRVRRFLRGVEQPRPLRPAALRDTGSGDYHLRDLPAVLPIYLLARPVHRASGERPAAQGDPCGGYGSNRGRGGEPGRLLRHQGAVPEWCLLCWARRVRPGGSGRLVRDATEVQGSGLPDGARGCSRGDGMDAAVGEADVGKTRWLLLVYRLPRDPSRHRVAVWRKLKALGALYLQDGVAALPEDAVTREQLEWLQVRVREAGGEATLWEGQPNTQAEDKELVEAFRSSREEAYQAIIAGAERVRRKAELGGGETLLAELGKLEREFRVERRRDYFRAASRKEASEVLKAARQAVREGESPSGKLGTGSGD